MGCVRAQPVFYIDSDGTLGRALPATTRWWSGRATHVPCLFTTGKPFAGISDGARARRSDRLRRMAAACPAGEHPGCGSRQCCFVCGAEAAEPPNNIMYNLCSPALKIRVLSTVSAYNIERYQLLGYSSIMITTASDVFCFFLVFPLMKKSKVN